MRLLSLSIEGSTDHPKAKIIFEAVNLGRSATALQPHVVCSAYRSRFQTLVVKLEVLDSERQLQPHMPATFAAEGTVPTEYLFTLYKRFRFELTRGRSSRIYMRRGHNIILGRVRYVGEVALYRATGLLPWIKLGMESL